jgi:hypothetical protein
MMMITSISLKLYFYAQKALREAFQDHHSFDDLGG